MTKKFQTNKKLEHVKLITMWHTSKSYFIILKNYLFYF
jgi:hypothetical protein